MANPFETVDEMDPVDTPNPPLQGLHPHLTYAETSGDNENDADDVLSIEGAVREERKHEQLEKKESTQKELQPSEGPQGLNPHTVDEIRTNSSSREKKTGNLADASKGGLNSSDERKDSVVYMKKLLSAAKRQIEELRKKGDEKNSIISRHEITIKDLKDKHEKVVGLAKRAQQRILDLETKLKHTETFGQGDNDEQVDWDLKGVILRVKQESGPVWCLCHGLSEQPGDGAVSSTITTSQQRQIFEWLEEDEVYCKVGDHDLPFALPQLCISVEQSTSLLERDSALQQENAELKEKFQKYRVRSEIIKKQLEAEVKRLSENAVSSKETSVFSADFRGQVEALKVEVDRLSSVQVAKDKEIQSLKSKNQQILSQLNQSRSRVDSLQSRIEEDRIAAAEESLLGQESLPRSELYDSPKDGQSASSAANADLIEQFSKLEREYDNYRKHAQRMIEEKELLLGSLNNPVEKLNGNQSQNTDHSKEHTKISGQHTIHVLEKKLQEQSQAAAVEKAYIKNILLRYMSAGEADRDPIGAALATALEFSPEEVQLVQQKSLSAFSMRSSGSWFGF